MFQNHPLFSGTSFVAKFQIPATFVPGRSPRPRPPRVSTPTPTATTSRAGRMTWVGDGAAAQVKGHPVPGGAGGQSPFAAAPAEEGGEGAGETGGEGEREERADRAAGPAGGGRAAHGEGPGGRIGGGARAPGQPCFAWVAG